MATIRIAHGYRIGRALSVEPRRYEGRPVIAREDFSLTDLTDLTQDHLVVGRKSGRPGEGKNLQESMLLRTRSNRNLGHRFYHAALAQKLNRPHVEHRVARAVGIDRAASSTNNWPGLK